MVPHVSVFVTKQRDAFSFKWQKHVLLLQPVIRTVVHWTTVISSSSKTLNPSIAPVVLMLSQPGVILTCLSVCVCPRHHPTASSCPHSVTWNGWMEFHHACLAKQGFQSLFSKPIPSAIISHPSMFIHSSMHLSFIIIIIILHLLSVKRHLLEKRRRATVFSFLKLQSCLTLIAQFSVNHKQKGRKLTGIWTQISQ